MDPNQRDLCPVSHNQSAFISFTTRFINLQSGQARKNKIEATKKRQFDTETREIEKINLSEWPRRCSLRTNIAGRKKIPEQQLFSIISAFMTSIVVIGRSVGFGSLQSFAAEPSNRKTASPHENAIKRRHRRAIIVSRLKELLRELENDFSASHFLSAPTALPVSTGTEIGLPTARHRITSIFYTQMTRAFCATVALCLASSNRRNSAGTSDQSAMHHVQTLPLKIFS